MLRKMCMVANIGSESLSDIVVNISLGHKPRGLLAKHTLRHK